MTDNRYLFHWLKTRDFLNYVSDVSYGVNMPRLGTKDGIAAPFVLAPLAEQKIIADKLDTLLAQLETTKLRLERTSKILRGFRQSVLTAAVEGKLTKKWRDVEKSDDWRASALRELIEKPQYGSSEKSQKAGLVPVLRMGNLQGGQLDWSDLAYSSDSDEINKYRLEVGDILFNRTNSPELVGKTAIFRGEREAIYAGYLIRIKCRPGLNAEFLNYHLNSPEAKNYCKAVKSDGVSQSNINAKKLSAYPLNLPPEEEQAEIVRRVDRLFAYAHNIENQINNALNQVKNLTQSILAKAFRGDLTADWRAANPELISDENSAKALLERITAERVSHIKQKGPKRRKYEPSCSS